MQHSLRVMLGIEDADQPVVSEDNEEHLEENLIEIERAAIAVKSDEDDVDTLVDSHAGLESLIDSMEATRDNGGMTATEANFATLALNANFARLGIEAHEIQVIPSAESFGGESERLAQTDVGLEALKDQAKALWEAIKQMVTNAIRSVREFFQRLFSNIDKMKARVKSLKQAVGGINGTTDKELDVPASITYGGKGSASDINKGLANLVDAVQKLYTSYPEDVAKYYNSIGVGIKDAKFITAESDDAVDKMMASAYGAQKEAMKVTASLQGNELPGGNVVKTTATGSGNNTVGTGAADVSGSVPKVVKTGSPKNVSVKAFSKSDLNSILDSCDKILTTIGGKKDAIEKINKARESAVAGGDALAKAAESGKASTYWTQAKLRAKLNLINRNMSGPISSITSLGFSTVQTATNFVAANVKAYKGKTEDKKDDDKKTD